MREISPRIGGIVRIVPRFFSAFPFSLRSQRPPANQRGCMPAATTLSASLASGPGRRHNHSIRWMNSNHSQKIPDISLLSHSKLFLFFLTSRLFFPHSVPCFNILAFELFCVCVCNILIFCEFSFAFLLQFFNSHPKYDILFCKYYMMCIRLQWISTEIHTPRMVLRDGSSGRGKVQTCINIIFHAFFCFYLRKLYYK